jgi:hypothetical protein
MPGKVKITEEELAGITKDSIEKSEYEPGL